jgi:hypothetical protein
VGSGKFPQLGWWLRGFCFCYERSLANQPYDLEAFCEWLHMHLDGPGNYDWIGIIQWKCGDSEKTTQKLFKYVDRYLKDVDELGVEKIIQDHADYEMRRYGFLSSSRLREGARIYR